jgi:hypothetical protein
MCAVAGGAASQTAQKGCALLQLCENGCNLARPESEAVYDMF